MEIDGVKLQRGQKNLRQYALTVGRYSAASDFLGLCAYPLCEGMIVMMFFVKTTEILYG
jgi:hypothetical protein